jgi:CHAP domain
VSETHEQEPKATDRLANLARLWRASNTAKQGAQVAQALKAGQLLVKGKVLFWIAVVAAALMTLFLTTIAIAALMGGMPTAAQCASASAATLAPTGGTVVGASEYGGPGDSKTPTDHSSSGVALDGHMAFAELGLPFASDPNPYDARNLGMALGYGKALPFHATVQITANGKSVVAEKLDVGKGGPPVGDPPHQRDIDLWWQTAQALGLDTAAGQWSGLVTVQVVNLPATPLTTSVDAAEPGAAAATSSLGVQVATAYAQDQHASPLGFAVVDTSGNIIASYNGNTTNIGRSITKTMLLVAYLRQTASQALSATAKTNLAAMIEQSANGNQGPGADWVYNHLHDPASQIEQVAHDAGMRDFHLDTSDPVYVLGRSRVSANDMALLFSHIQQLMPTTQQSYGMSLLANIAPGDPGHTGIYHAGVSTSTIYSKSGWEQETNGGYTFNQAALITVGAHQYAVAVLTGGNVSYADGESIVQNIDRDLFAPVSTPNTPLAAPECNESSGSEPTSALAPAIVQIAQSQLNVYDGGNYCSPYSHGRCPEPWCSDFLTWVWQHAGIDIPDYPFSGDVYTWGQRNTQVLPPTATPTPGDAVEFGTGPQNSSTSVHVGIVEDVFPNGEITVINGDFGHRVERSGPFQPAESAANSGSGSPIYGYVVP